MRSFLCRVVVPAVFVCAFAGPVLAQSSTLTNADIVKMVKGGVPPPFIEASIQRARVRNFDLSADALVELKKQGVPDSVIGMMFKTASPSEAAPMAPSAAGPPAMAVIPNDPAALREAGVFLEKGDGASRELVMLAETSSRGMRVGAWGSALTMGIKKSTAKYRVRDPRAEIRVASPLPVFYISQHDPRDVVLLKLAKKGKEREFESGKIGGISGGIEGPKGDVEFLTEKVAPGVFKVTFPQPLPPGEYGFGIMGATVGMVSSVLDFGVDRVAPGRR